MEWNKRNILPFYNKGDTQSLKINCPVFLLLMSLKDSCLNKCKCLLFTSKVVLFHQTNLDLNQETLVSTSVLLLLIKFINLLKENLNKEVILQIYLKLDKHVAFKSIQNAISGNLLNILSDFFNDTKQKFVLKELLSAQKYVQASVPKDFSLGSSMFLIYKNDWSKGLSVTLSLDFDHTILFSIKTIQILLEIHF